MPTYRVKAPDGSTYKVTAPEGSTPEQIKARVQAQSRQGRGALRAVNRENFLGHADAAVRGFTDMASFGLADKAVAGLNAVLPLDKATNPNIKSVWETGDFGNAFRNNLNQEQSIAASDQQDDGRSWARGAGQVAGAVVGPVPGRALLKSGATNLAKAAVRAGAPARAIRPVASAARIAGEGAIQSGLHGLGSGDSTSIAQRLAKGRDEALAGGAGALVGAGIVRGGARALSPVVNPAVAKLAKMGVVMTPGQRAGRGVTQWAENVGESVPGLGVAIRGAKRRGVEQFNIGSINEALKPIAKALPNRTQAGRTAIEAAQETIGNTYDEALANISAPVDQSFQQGISAIVQRAANLPPQEAKAFEFIMQNKVGPLLARKQGLDGATLQDVTRTLQKLASDADKTPVSGEFLGDELRAVRQHFIDLAGRHSPEATDLFLRANAAEANMSRIYDAASKAHGDGVFTPQQLSAATAKRGYGTTTKRAAAGNARLQDVADAGKSILPNNVPNSGTAERGAALAAIAGIGGGATFNPAVLGLAAPAIPYAPGIDALLQKFALRGQGKTAKGLAEEIRKRAYIGGMVGAPVGLLSND